MAENRNIPHPRRVCHLAKQNLPGLMGRRDAAWDQAVKMTLLTETDEHPAAAQLKVCADVLELLQIAYNDTASILQLLSSPDTESRERKLYALQEITLSMADAWNKLTVLEQDLFGADSILTHFNAIGNAEENAAPLQKLHDSRTMLLDQLRHTLNSAEFRLERYRGYTAKSFSAAYAERYKNAYANYRKLYAEKFSC
jgi:hypothetical protein